MSPVFGMRDRFGAEHARARELAAERLAEPLAPEDADWLATHLRWCAPCRAVAGEYEAQRLELRGLRLDEPPPPRDLWARTAAAIDIERGHAGAGRVQRRATTTPTIKARGSVPLGALSGLLVVALVVGATMIGGRGLLPGPNANRTVVPSATSVAATPLAVAAREVPMLRMLAGTSELSYGRVREVCPVDAGDVCASPSIEQRQRLPAVPQPKAGSVLISPTRSQLVLVGREPGDDGDTVYVVPVPPAATPTPTAPPSAEPPASADPPASGEPPASEEPPASGEPPASEEPPSSQPPTASEPPATSEPGPTEPPTPTEPPAGSPDAPPSADPAPTPTVEVTPGPDGAVAIASDVVTVGQTASYSRDGSAFAFTARPADGSRGPDVYLWNVGDPVAVPVTDDHRSVFADWVGTELLISRVSAASQGGDGGLEVLSVLLDPATGLERLVPVSSMWRPTVDPAGRLAVWWDGSVEALPNGDGWRPGIGELVLGSWRASAGQERPTPPGRADVLAGAPLAEWQAQWDETGTRLALWIADPADPARGSLSLYVIEPSSGRIDREGALLEGAPALPDFTIGAGRLAWVSPSEEGTRIAILAWTTDGVGTVEFMPGESVSLVR